MYSFVAFPTTGDFRTLARHILTAETNQLHPGLCARRAEVADALVRMAEEPAREEHRAAYHALRLFVW